MGKGWFLGKSHRESLARQGPGAGSFSSTSRWARAAANKRNKNKMCQAHHPRLPWSLTAEEGIIPILWLGKQSPRNKSEVTRLVSAKAQTKIQASNSKTWGICQEISIFFSLTELFLQETLMWRSPQEQIKQSCTEWVGLKLHPPNWPTLSFPLQACTLSSACHQGISQNTSTRRESHRPPVAAFPALTPKTV